VLLVRSLRWRTRSLRPMGARGHLNRWADRGRSGQEGREPESTPRPLRPVGCLTPFRPGRHVAGCRLRAQQQQQQQRGQRGQRQQQQRGHGGCSSSSSGGRGRGSSSAARDGGCSSSGGRGSDSSSSSSSMEHDLIIYISACLLILFFRPPDLLAYQMAQDPLNYLGALRPQNPP
jgi:hypothetical protein